jgi:hypothetical protein
MRVSGCRLLRARGIETGGETEDRANQKHERNRNREKKAERKA